MVDVVCEPDGDTALRGAGERVLDDLRDRRVETEVVEGEVERALRRAEERGDLACDVRGGLAAVGQRADVDQDAARCFALYARFQPWYSTSFSGESTTPSVGCSGSSGRAISTP
jgi:hypothetical protein